MSSSSLVRKDVSTSPNDTDASSVSSAPEDDQCDYIQAVSAYLENPKRFLNEKWVAAARANIQNFNPYKRLFQLDAHMAAGASANAYIFNEIDEEGEELRQVIVKLGHSHEDDKDTQKELEILELLRESRHIVNSIDVERSGLRRPILIMEYLKHGSLYNLQRRVLHLNTAIPNRVLWSIFLCCK